MSRGFISQVREGEREREKGGWGEGVSGGFISQVREGERDREGGGEERGVRRLHITGEGGRER